MHCCLKYILLFVLTVVSLRAVAQNEESMDAGTDDAAVVGESAVKKPIRVALLTCTAGNVLYSKFGHTALLVWKDGEKDGAVCNYGCFNYNADNFVMNFLLGHTDYILDAEPYSHFVRRYMDMGMGVYGQELNLSEQEIDRLVQLLNENLLPGNQAYRYNWLYNNCTEKARDVVEIAVDGDVQYGKVETDITVREMLRECLKNDPWKSFGIDMILGEKIDRPTSSRTRMFLPEHYKNGVDGAMRQGVPFVKSTRQIIEAKNVAATPSFLLSPAFVFGMLLIVICIISVYEYRRRQNYVFLDVLLHTLQGLAGLLVAFLFFFSEHPAVDSNWLVIIFNPVPLFYAAWLVYCKTTKRNNILAYINLCVLAGFFITMMICRQSFNIAMYFIVLSLLTRAVAQSYNAYRKIR